MKFIKHITSKIALTLTIGLTFLSFKPVAPEEGMFLLSQIGSLDLQNAGLKIPLSEVYNPDGVSLIDALVRLDGCTGSFVSNEGLIITNHHCAFGAAAAISSKENNYIENGFYAETLEKEVKTSMTCKITQSYLDVSSKVLYGVEGTMAYEKKNEIININSQAIIKEESALNPNLKIEISQMSIGKQYTLFRYKVLTDIRLVYVPPRSVGEFGGESDNWVWPRHNADFSYVRAYENDKPFMPKKFLKVNPNGTKENDFVFILGYPGRTYRHQPYKFLEYQRDQVLPFVANWYEFKIKSMHAWAGNDESRKILVASYIKSLANTSKNFRGKIQGLRRTNVIDEKRDENEKLKEFVKSSTQLKETYWGVIEKIDELYDLNISLAKRDLLVNELYSSVGVFHASNFINNANAELTKLPKEERKATLEKNREEMRKSFQPNYRVYSAEIDKAYLTKLLIEMNDLPENLKPNFLKNIKGKSDAKTNITRFVNGLYKKSKLQDSKATWALFEKDLTKFVAQKEPMMKFAALVSNEATLYQKAMADRNGQIAALMPKFTEIKMKFHDSQFIPDANSTLRLTYGHVKGYSPEDGVYNKPYTYLKGILEKAKESGDFYLQPNILNSYKTIQAADNLVDKSTNDVAVALLYNLDTTGGNSGSPVLDANGDLIGVNFDRAFTATINDYAWNEQYSRSIGVDIRYVLYVMKYIGKTDRLISELNVML
ncbi:MAG: S46 family peptidase [Bacteroidia bacterium]